MIIKSSVGFYRGIIGIILRLPGKDLRNPQNALSRYTVHGYGDYGLLNKVTLPGKAQKTSEYALFGKLVKTINAHRHGDRLSLRCPQFFDRPLRNIPALDIDRPLLAHYEGSNHLFHDSR